MIVDKIKKRQVPTNNKTSNIDIPVGKWIKCDNCKEILYKEPIKLPINPGHGMSLMREYWNEQAEAARQESTFSLRFLRNFKSEINNYINF